MKKAISIFLKVLVTLLLIGWIVVILTDFFRVKQNKSPMFCLSQDIKEYSDGSSSTCTGLGYKVIRYDRTCLSATEFGPFFLIQERQCES